MENVTHERVRLSAPEGRALAEEALAAAGFDRDEARIVAEHVVDAALCGYEYAGLPKLLSVFESPRFREPRTPMRQVRENAFSILFDGGNNVGMLTMYRAAEAAIAKAREHGLALVCVHGSWLSGRGAHYVEMIARAGLVAVHTVSANRRVAPPGGTRATVGTNPIAFGFPTEAEPLVIDLGTSAISFSDLLFRQDRGELLPEGVAIDVEGRPTRDPALAQLGAVLPFGEYKGFALALAAEALGVLAGTGDGADKSDGYFLLAIEPGLFVAPEDYRRQLSTVVARIKATPRQPGVDEIRIPSEHAFRTRARSLREGIEIDRHVYETLLALSRGR